jgi:ElaB/YqjD/DUF883 family membrane-anchored ribosome-binding protein
LLPILPSLSYCQAVWEEKGFFMDAPRTREDVRDDLEAITDQINEGIEKGRYTLTQLQSSLVNRTKQAAASTDQLVHENPWGAIGVGVALGVLLGYLMPRR